MIIQTKWFLLIKPKKIRRRKQLFHAENRAASILHRKYIVKSKEIVVVSFLR